MDEFFIAIENEKHFIEKNPYHYEDKYKGIRRAITKRFPYTNLLQNRIREYGFGLCCPAYEKKSHEMGKAHLISLFIFVKNTCYENLSVSIQRYLGKGLQFTY